MSEVVLEWRGEFDKLEVNKLHAEAFETHIFDESEWNWRRTSRACRTRWRRSCWLRISTRGLRRAPAALLYR
jgi:hypothetical protein